MGGGGMISTAGLACADSRFSTGNQQAIAAASHCLDVFRGVGGISEGLTQFVDGGVDAVVELNHGVVGPKLSLDLFPADDLSGALDEHAQDLEGLFLQTPDFIVGAA